MITIKIVNSKGINFKSIAFGDKGGNKFPLLNPSAKCIQDVSVIFFDWNLLHLK